MTRLCALAVRDFRNLARVDLELSEEGLVLVGENGQGKTNLLEAVYYLSLLRSGRGAHDQEVVRFGASGFHINAAFTADGEHEVSVGFEKSTKRKRVRVDGIVTDRFSDALGALPAVMFSPADVALVAGAPAARRRYLDILLAMTSRAYLSALRRYRTALAHRNAALRDASRSRGSARAHESRIAVWETPLAKLGAELLRERRAWVAEVAARFAALCAAIAASDRLEIRYASAISSQQDAEGALARELEQRRTLDIRRGITHAGPHRDDLVITIAGGDNAPYDLRTFGSAGQQRTAAIAMRLLEAETLRDRRRDGCAPVFLLDDPFSELDVRRAHRVMRLLTESGLGQTLLTVPRASDIPAGLTKLERRNIVAGTVRP